MVLDHERLLDEEEAAGTASGSEAPPEVDRNFSTFLNDLAASDKNNWKTYITPIIEFIISTGFSIGNGVFYFKEGGIESAIASGALIYNADEQFFKTLGTFNRARAKVPYIDFNKGRLAYYVGIACYTALPMTFTVISTDGLDSAQKIENVALIYAIYTIIHALSADVVIDAEAEGSLKKWLARVLNSPFIHLPKGVVKVCKKLKEKLSENGDLKAAARIAKQELDDEARNAQIKLSNRFKRLNEFTQRKISQFPKQAKEVESAKGVDEAKPATAADIPSGYDALGEESPIDELSIEEIIKNEGNRFSQDEIMLELFKRMDEEPELMEDWFDKTVSISSDVVGGVVGALTVVGNFGFLWAGVKVAFDWGSWYLMVAGGAWPAAFVSLLTVSYGYKAGKSAIATAGWLKRFAQANYNVYKNNADDNREYLERVKEEAPTVAKLAFKGSWGTFVLALACYAGSSYIAWGSDAAAEKVLEQQLDFATQNFEWEETFALGFGKFVDGLKYVIGTPAAGMKFYYLTAMIVFSNRFISMLERRCIGSDPKNAKLLEEWRQKLTDISMVIKESDPSIVKLFLTQPDEDMRVFFGYNNVGEYQVFKRGMEAKMASVTRTQADLDAARKTSWCSWWRSEKVPVVDLPPAPVITVQGAAAAKYAVGVV